MTELLFMKDIESNYIKEFDATVIETGDPQYVILDRTAFYPEGGGQPSDAGMLYWDSDTKNARVKLVTKKGGVKHFIDGEAPPKGTKIHGVLDWSHRYSLMKMHTAQHLLSGIVYDLFNGVHTVGNQIHPAHSRADFYPVKFTDEDLQSIEEECNRMIDMKLDVRIYEESRESLETRMKRHRANLDLIPKSINILRIVEIEGFDIVPCAGTHVRNLSEIGKMKILGRETKGKDKERIAFELLNVRG